MTIKELKDRLEKYDEKSEIRFWFVGGEIHLYWRSVEEIQETKKKTIIDLNLVE